MDQDQDQDQDQDGADVMDQDRDRDGATDRARRTGMGKGEAGRVAGMQASEDRGWNREWGSA